MARWFHKSSEAKGYGAIVRTVVALCLASQTPVALGFEKSEAADSATSATDAVLASSGLAGLASIESAVQEMAAMKWSSGSNVAVAQGDSSSTGGGNGAKKDGATGEAGPKNSFLPPGALEAARAASMSDNGGSSAGNGGGAAASKDAAVSSSPSSATSSSTTSTSSSSFSKSPSLTMPSSDADRLKRMSDRINGSLGTLAGTVKDAQDRNKTPLNPTGKDKKMNEGGSPLDRDAASKSKFGAQGDLSLNTIADNRTKEDDPFEEFLKDQKKKQQANKDKEKSKEEKEKEEKERQELEQKMTELANKPPPYTLQDYYDFRDLIAKKNKALGDAADGQPEFAKKASEIFDQFSSRDGDEAKKSAFRDFVENNRDRELFQNPIIVDPNLDTHRAGVSH